MQKPVHEAQPMDNEQAAALGALMNEAQAEPLTPGTPEAIAAEEAANAPQVDLAAELSGLLMAVSSVLKPAFPSLEKIYNEQSCGAAGAAVASVCNKHGWLEGGVVGGWGEELAALMVIGPMAIATAVGVRADIAAQKASEGKQGEPGQGIAGPITEPVVMARG